MNHYVYEITNLINGKKYIGKRSCRCSIEEDKYMGSGKLIKLAEKKYGIENFKKEVLYVCDSEEIAFELEKVYIEEVKAYSNSNYYNISSGGNGGFNNFAGKTEKELDLWKKRMSDSRKGRVITDEWKAKILKTRREKGIGVGSSNGMYGRKGVYSHMSKPLVMISLEGEYVKEFACAREAAEYVCGSKSSSFISRVCVNKEGTAYGYLWLHKEDYENMMRNHNYENWIKYMINSYVLRLKKTNRGKSQNNSKSVYKLDIHGLYVIEEYGSIASASERTGINRNSISRNCRHGCNTAGGFSWCFVEEYNNLSKEDLNKLYSLKYTKPPKECYKGNKKPVICLNTKQVFDGIVDAVEYFNLCKGARIDAVCRGTRKSTGKHPKTNEPLKWMYYEEYLNQCEISA